MKKLNTQEVIKNKKRLIDTHCQGMDSISLHNKSSLEQDIKVLQAYNQETYELNDNEISNQIKRRTQEIIDSILSSI